MSMVMIYVFRPSVVMKERTFYQITIDKWDFVKFQTAQKRAHANQRAHLLSSSLQTDIKLSTRS